MKLTNTTSFPDQFIRDVVQLVLPVPPVEPEELEVRRIRNMAFFGQATPGKLRVLAAIGPEKCFPMERPPYKDYQRLVLNSREEALVYVLAHEIRHLWQFWNPSLPRLKRGRFVTPVLCNTDADLYAKEIINTWIR